MFEATDAGVEGPSETYDYVINRLLLDDSAPTQSDRGFYGFNLDGRFSPSSQALLRAEDCGWSDHFSIIDPDQNTGTCVVGELGGGSRCGGGVDNQLPNILYTLLSYRPTFVSGGQLFAQQIDLGRYTLIVRVLGVHGVPGPSLNDPAVTIRVYPVAWPVSEDCASVQRPMQTYAVDDRSLREAGNLDTPLLEFPGCVLRGRLRQVAPQPTSAPTPMVLPLVDSARLPLHDLRLRFDLATGEATSGNLGGTLSTTEVVTALGTVVSDRLALKVIPMLGYQDVAFGGASGVNCDYPPGLISVGLGFTALRANIQPTTVSGPIPGACGSP